MKNLIVALIAFLSLAFLGCDGEQSDNSSLLLLVAEDKPQIDVYTSDDIINEGGHYFPHDKFYVENVNYEGSLYCTIHRLKEGDDEETVDAPFGLFLHGGESIHEVLVHGTSSDDEEEITVKCGPHPTDESSKKIVSFTIWK